MTQGLAYNPNQPVSYADSPNLDSFGRLRVSNSLGIFNCQLTYDLQPLLFEQITSGSGATVTYDSTNRDALMTFSSTPTGGKAFMQSYDHIRYQPGKSQFVFITFNMIAGVANVLKFAGYSDGVNGIEFQMNGSTPQFEILSGTSLGNTTVTQSNWNLDKLDGTGSSGITFDVSKIQILILDLQALYSGRVRIGFDIGGNIVYCHQFLNANISASPYIQSANLPIRVGMTCTGTVSTTMNFICSSVSSEGGKDNLPTYTFSTGASVTAGNGVDTYVMSLQPRTTFNSITNRVKFALDDIDFSVTGANNVLWKLCIGQALTGTSYTNVNATYSAFNIDTAGALSGSPVIVLASGYASSNKTASSGIADLRYPITLDAAGAVRNLGTLCLIVQGIGGTSAMSAQIAWSEER